MATDMLDSIYFLVWLSDTNFRNEIGRNIQYGRRVCMKAKAIIKVCGGSVLISFYNEFS